jgi:hypothetical protein
MVLSAQTTVLKVKVGTANIRSQPDTGAAVIKQVKLGTLLESKQKVGDWYEISVTNELGVSLTAYVHVNVVDVVSGGAAPTPEETRPVAPPVSQPQPQAQPATVQTPVSDTGYMAPVARSAGGFKIMAAYAMASISTSDADTNTELGPYKKSLAGFGGGVGFTTGGLIGLEIDLMYLPKGVRLQGTAPDTDPEIDFDFKAHFNEISLPVLLKVNIPVQNLNPYLLAGGEIAYIAKAKYSYNVTDGVDTESGEEDFGEDTADIDYGLVFGGGVGIPLGGMNVFVELRYHLGMANLEKNPEEGDATMKTNLFLLMAGLKF